MTDLHRAAGAGGLADALGDPALARRVLDRALAGRAAWAEVYHEVRTDGSVTMNDGERTSRSASLTEGVGLRAVGPAGTCNVYGPAPDPAALLRLAERAADAYDALAGGGAPGEPPTAPAGRPESAARLWADANPADANPWADARWDETLDLGRLEAHAAAALAAATETDTDGVRVRATTWSRSVVVVNSLDGRARWTTRGTRFAVDAFARRGADRRRGRANHCSDLPVGAIDAAPAQDAGRRAAAQAHRVLGTSAAPPAAVPVVLAPAAAALLVHELLGHPCEADMVAGGTSPLRPSGPAPALDSCVTVLDGCPPQGGWGRADRDDEGTPNAETVVIDRGVPSGVLTDRASAEAHGWALTGNGRRQSYAHPVLPRVSGTRLAAGTSSADALVAGLGDGLWVLAAQGGSVNARTGMLTIDVKEARLVRGGVPGERVSATAVAAHARDVLRGIRAVADDPLTCPMICGKHGQWIPVAAQAPSVLVERMQTVGG
ncbi:putative TldD/PmbA family protein [Actinacidiphila reveromycinica]|uniref:Putative TldD/PmbA family protein n=1 Tax=Actinacidiphila reveromycinica TaxID=659352 RepID=A0A7U3UN24_9ACTN|nr:TldD/PmbA family protein [Streptomyces sp. SN-593]BBA95586.1 putative TldD/PmbA family protein [Streptomyces sp. SN-593]